MNFRVKTHYSFVPSKEVPPPSAIVKVGVAKCCPHTSVFVCTCLYPRGVTQHKPSQFYDLQSFIRSKESLKFIWNECKDLQSASRC